MAEKNTPPGPVVHQEIAPDPAAAPLAVGYDPATDILTIDGLRYSGQLFRAFGLEGHVLEVLQVRSGIVTVRRWGAFEDLLADVRGRCRKGVVVGDQGVLSPPFVALHEDLVAQCQEGSLCS